MNNCPFCKTRSGWNFEHVNVIHSKYPVTPRGHLLIIPKRHIEDFNSLNGGEMNDIFNAIGFGIEYLKEKYGFKSFNVGWNLGRDAGQTIPHLHCHIIARRKGDVDDPRGGIRNIIPKKGNYLRGQ